MNMKQSIIVTALAALLTMLLAACTPWPEFYRELQEGGPGGAHHGMSFEEHAVMYAEHHKEDVARAINAPDRSEAHRERDANRHPEATLTFSQIEPGSRVLDLGAGGGYFTLLMSGLMGPEGHVTGQNPQSWADRFGANWPEVHGAMIASRGNMDFMVAEFDDLGVAPGSYDAITFMLTYHDAALIHEDRTAMNRGMFEALRPGGLLLLSDNSGPDGSGLATTDTLHRIGQELVRAELEAAGFVLVMESDALRNPDDDRSLYVFDDAIRGRQDKFLMLFQRP